MGRHQCGLERARQRPGRFDRWYVESHLLGGRDVLITDDLALRRMCDRLRNEHGFPVHAESLCGYVAHHR